MYNKLYEAIIKLFKTTTRYWDIDPNIFPNDEMLDMIYAIAIPGSKCTNGEATGNVLVERVSLVDLGDCNCLLATYKLLDAKMCTPNVNGYSLITYHGKATVLQLINLDKIDGADIVVQTREIQEAVTSILSIAFADSRNTKIQCPRTTTSTLYASIYITIAVIRYINNTTPITNEIYDLFRNDEIPMDNIELTNKLALGFEDYATNSKLSVKYESEIILSYLSTYVIGAMQYVIDELGLEVLLDNSYIYALFNTDYMMALSIYSQNYETRLAEIVKKYEAISKSETNDEEIIETGDAPNE